MGLCKCPQRKVTNIFCYEHRVNVCEYCLTKNHPTCVVDTYRNWITDSVYTTKCALCEDELASAETIRFYVSVNIVHWKCLDSWARQMPPTTAPAGYSCPVCKKMCLFPAINQVSPIADALREKMSHCNWSRVGICLPLLDQEAKQNSVMFNGYHSPDGHLSPGFSDRGDADSVSDVDSNFDARSLHQHSNSVVGNHQAHSSGQSPDAYGTPKLSQSYGSGGPSNSFYNDAVDIAGSTSRKAPVRTGYDTPLLIDEDDNKYHRRSAFESLSRWIKNFLPVGKRRITTRRKALYAVIGVIGIIVLFMILFGRGTNDDLEFNPHLNPHVKVDDK